MSEEWVIRINLGEVDSSEASAWIDFISDAVLQRDPGFSGLVSMMKEISRGE